MDMSILYNTTMSDTDSQVVTVEVTSSEDEKDVGGAAAPAASLRSESPSAGGHSTASLRSESPSARGHSTVRKGMRPVIGDGAAVTAVQNVAAKRVGLNDVNAVLPRLVTSKPLSFNQLKVEIAKRLHIEVDDAVFKDHKQSIKDSYVKVHSNTKTGKSKPSSAGSRLAPSSVPLLLSRNSTGWSYKQDLALLTEVVNGETYLMIKPKGKKVEERTLIQRARGIPHGYTIQFWNEIMEKLQRPHWKNEDGLPLFACPLKKDYCSNRFDTLVNRKLSEDAKKKQKFGVNNDDFETGEGDNSQDEAKNDSEPDHAADKESINSLLEAYLAQQKCFQENEASDEIFGGAAGGKRSGQPNEDGDRELIENTANGKGKEKKQKLPKLPMPTHVEKSQAEALEHSSHMSKGWEKLADAQKPSSVEDFTKKSGAIIEQSGKAIGEIMDKVAATIGTTVEKGFEAFSKYKMQARACVHVDGHDFQIIGQIMVCKRCMNTAIVPS